VGPETEERSLTVLAQPQASFFAVSGQSRFSISLRTDFQMASHPRRLPQDAGLLFCSRADCLQQPDYLPPLF
jgi:hypothetical protein